MKLVLWRHWMHEVQVHSVMTENQFHCTRLYRSCALKLLFPVVQHLLVRIWNHLLLYDQGIKASRSNIHKTKSCTESSCPGSGIPLLLFKTLSLDGALLIVQAFNTASHRQTETFEKTSRVGGPWSPFSISSSLSFSSSSYSLFFSKQKKTRNLSGQEETRSKKWKITKQ